MKRRSAAKTPQQPLEGWTLLMEESLGRKAPAALRESGLSVIAQGESPDVPRGISDERLVALVGQHPDWVLVSKDLEMRYRPNERLAIVAARLRVFQLTRGPWTTQEMVSALLAARARMESAAQAAAAAVHRPHQQAR